MGGLAGVSALLRIHTHSFTIICHFRNRDEAINAKHVGKVKGR